MASPEPQFELETEDRQADSPEARPVSAGSQESDRTTAMPNDDIDLARRVVPVVSDVEDDVCSICLDNFTEDDPGCSTRSCGHCYHLQCIMQWAQRSRECPMCFKPLALENPDLNELLPFGEYVPPEQLAESFPHFSVGLDAWELERLLQRLAGTELAGSSGGADQEASTSTGLGNAQNGASGGVPEEAYPSSWPPSTHLPSRGDGEQTLRESIDMKGPAEALKSRWAAVSSRWKESFSKTTHDLKGRFGGRANGPTSPGSSQT